MFISEEEYQELVIYDPAINNDPKKMLEAVKRFIRDVKERVPYTYYEKEVYYSSCHFRNAIK